MILSCWLPLLEEPSLEDAERVQLGWVAVRMWLMEWDGQLT